MALHYYPKANQATGAFDNGAILEYKPVNMGPSNGSAGSLSTLFYWANAWSDQGGLIGLHPHRGFEIMSYVVEGAIEHYDTANQEWMRLEKGAIQIIRSGNGISHSERLLPGSRMFQIWFDPDISKTLVQPASYDDYPAEVFPELEIDNGKKIHFTSPDSPLKKISDGDMASIKLDKGAYQEAIDAGRTQFWFLTKGNATLNGQAMQQFDLVNITDEDAIRIETDGECEFFRIDLPVEPGYQTYASRAW